MLGPSLLINKDYRNSITQGLGVGQCKETGLLARATETMRRVKAPRGWKVYAIATRVIVGLSLLVKHIAKIDFMRDEESANSRRYPHWLARQLRCGVRRV